MAKRRVKLTPPTEHPKTEGGWWYYVSGEWSKILEAIIEPLYQSYRWEWDNPELAEQAKQWSLEIDRVKELPVIEKEVPVYTESDCPPLPRGVEIVGNTVNIYECENPDMIVNIFGCGCGCGDGQVGGGGGGGIGVSGGGGNDGFGTGGGYIAGVASSGGVSDSNAITQCDFITTIIPLVIDQMKELLVTIDNNNENIGEALEAIEELTDAGSIAQDAIAFAGELISNILLAGSGAVLAMLLDNDFQFRMQEAWVKAHGTTGSITSVTYNDLNSMTRYLPLTWIETGAIIFPRILMPLLFRVINLGKTNSRIIVAKGTAQTGLCEYIYAGAGVEYIAPPNQLALPVPGLGFAYEWGRRFDFIEGTQGWASSGDGTHTVGLGWTGSGGNANDYRVIVQESITAQLTGLRIGMDRSLQGDKNEVNIGTSYGGDNILADSQHFGQNPIVIALDYASSGNFCVRVTENAYTNNDDDDFDAYIEYIDLFGIGTPPSGGVEI